MMVYTVEEVAGMLKLKPYRSNGKTEWHGPNPLGHGATDDGFILFEEGNAIDRPAGIIYKSKEVAEMAGIGKESYLPCVEYKEMNGAGYMSSAPQRTTFLEPRPNLTILRPVPPKKTPKTYDTRSLQERGITQQTMDDFQVVFQKGTYWEYPTIHSSGEMGRHRWKFRDPVSYWAPRKPNKNIWCPSDTASIPNGYNLPNAVGKEEVYLVNGEVSVWVCHQAGITAIAPLGESKSYDKLMRELAQIGVLKLTIILDNDEAGHKASVKAKLAAEENDIEVTVMELIGKVGRDVSDLYEDCEFDDKRFLNALDSLPIATPRRLAEWETGFKEEALEDPIVAPQKPYDLPATKPAPEDEKMARAQSLVELVVPKIETFIADDSQTYASVPVDDHFETYDVTGSDFSKYLRMEWRKEKGGKVLDATTIKDVVADIESRVFFSKDKKKVEVRSAMHDGKIYIDLLNDDWEVVEIDQEGWRVLKKSPVHFRRAIGMEPLPYPQTGGDLNELREILNAEDEEEWIKMMAWLVTAMRPPVAPYPVASIHGEQGSAKSTACKILRQIVDPNFTKLIGTAPVDEHKLSIQAKNSFVIGFDNLSGMPKWLSDALCSLATEGGFRTRKLHTNDEEMLFKARRPIILNGIDEMIGREDFRNRCIVINLPIISKQKRKEEETIWQQFEEMHPRLMGAIFTIMSHALKNVGSVCLTESPRMADFAKWVVAAESMMPWENNTDGTSRFMQIYTKNIEESTVITLEASPLATEIVEIMRSTQLYVATPKAMFATLNERAGHLNRDAHGWPSSPAHLSTLLKRIAPNLRAGHAIDVATGQKDDNGERCIVIRHLNK